MAGPGKESRKVMMDKVSLVAISTCGYARLTSHAIFPPCPAKSLVLHLVVGILLWLTEALSPQTAKTHPLYGLNHNQRFGTANPKQQLQPQLPAINCNFRLSTTATATTSDGVITETYKTKIGIEQLLPNSVSRCDTTR